MLSCGVAGNTRLASSYSGARLRPRHCAFLGIRVWHLRVRDQPNPRHERARAWHGMALWPHALPSGHPALMNALPSEDCQQQSGKAIHDIARQGARVFAEAFIVTSHKPCMDHWQFFAPPLTRYSITGIHGVHTVVRSARAVVGCSGLGFMRTVAHASEVVGPRGQVLGARWSRVLV